MSILGSGLVLFGTIAVAFIVYVLVMITWRSSRYHLSNQGTTNPAEQKNKVSLNLDPYSASTFKYKKGIESTETPSFSERECTVCLSDLEDEEYVRQLSQCRHSFHAQCIDMWMCYHSDRPLCRTPIHRLLPVMVDQQESRNNWLLMMVDQQESSLCRPSEIPRMAC